MSRLTRIGLLALIALLTLTVSASADIRTGSAPNRYPEAEDSSPTQPELDRASIRYDDQAGTLQVTISLVDPLADPAATSALRPWRFFVGLGDYLNGICVGEGDSGLLLAGSLEDPAQAALDAWPDFGDTYAAAPVTQTLSADRTQVQLSVTDPRLVGLNLICADATIRDTRESSTASSHTFAFLMDGYHAADGALAREINDYLWAETNTVAVRLRPGRAVRRSRSPAGSCTARCSPAAAAARCADRAAACGWSSAAACASTRAAPASSAARSRTAGTPKASGSRSPGSAARRTRARSRCAASRATSPPAGPAPSRYPTPSAFSCARSRFAKGWQ
jgi:hypothetical protein